MRRAVLGCLLLAALAAPAAAAPKVTVDVDGDDTGLVRRTVKRVLAEQDVQRPVIVYGTVEKVKRKGKKKVTIRLTITAKDGTVLGEIKVEAATREAAAARAGRKLPGAVAMAKQEPRPAPKAKARANTTATAKKPSTKTKTRTAARPDVEEGDDAGSGSESESDSGSGSDSADGVAMSVSPEPADAGTGTWLTVAAGPELVARHFSYRDDVFQELRQYDLAGAAAIGMTADAYPLRERRDWLAGLGGAARLWYARPFDSDAVNGETYRSASHGWAIGGRWRRTVAGVEVAGALDLGSQSFTVDAAGSEYESMVPAVSYTYLRPGVSGRMRFLDRYAAELALGYRHVLSSGEIASEGYFPRLAARGFDLEGQVSYALPFLSGLDVRAGAGIEQYGFDLNPEPGDARVAGGATDRYPRMFVRLGYSR